MQMKSSEIKVEHIAKLLTITLEETNLNWLLEKRDELADMSSNTDIEMNDRATCDEVANLLTDVLIACYVG